jgi:cytochrome c oxidase cbb3-type subunit III
MRLFPAMLLITASLAWAQTPTAGNPDQGRKTFAKFCAFCHGSEATGGEGPNLVLSAVVRHDKNGDLISEVIHNGRPDKGMPAIPLSAGETADVVAFIHARVKESDRRSAGKPNAGYPLARLNTGNAEAGKVFFASHCTECHAAQKDLAGIAKKYPPVEFQSRFLYPTGVKQTATVHSANGKTYTGELVYADAFTIAIRDRDGWYHSWPASAVKADISDPRAGHRELLGQYREADFHNVFAYLETLQ